MWDVVRGARSSAKQMMARGQGGYILNIASAAASTPSYGLAAYMTTKVAVLMFSECMHNELTRQGIDVPVIYPGFVGTGTMASTVYSGTTEVQRA